MSNERKPPKGLLHEPVANVVGEVFNAKDAKGHGSEKHGEGPIAKNDKSVKEFSNLLSGVGFRKGDDKIPGEASQGPVLHKGGLQ